MTKRVFLIFVALFFGLNAQTLAQAKKAAPVKKAVSAPAVPVQKTEPQPATPANELTVEQVIQLVQAGLSEDLIIAKIKKNNKAFDLSTEQILQLKKVGASDNIIRVLMDPQAQPVTAPATPLATAPATAPTTVQAVAIPQTPQAEGPAQGPVVEEVGFYLMEEGKPVQLTATAFSKQKIGGLGMMKMAATMGVMKAKQKAVLRGSSALIRTKNRRPEFFFYAPEGFSPTDYLALKLEKKGSTREAVVGSVGIVGASGGFEDKNILKFKSTKLAPRKYIINFESDLNPGEYCFYPISELRTAGGAMSASGRLYDFGIE